MLYDRIVETGTLREEGGVPDPQFALPSTVNWMRALAIVCKNNRLTKPEIYNIYANVQRRAFSSREENSIFEQMFFALHQLSALEAFKTVPRRSDVARMGIVTWYYGIYYAASAMIAAQDGSIQQDHAGTAACWDRQIAERKFALAPFDLRLSSIVKSKVKEQIVGLRAGSGYDLKTAPSTMEESIGACCSYLSGTSEFYRWRASEDLKETKDFKMLGVSDFRTKAARHLRDERFDARPLSFLHLASRYRGKANYREALFLGYGAATETLLAGFVDDLTSVLQGFLTMAGGLVSKRLGRALWFDFVADVEARRAFSLSPTQVWIASPPKN